MSREAVDEVRSLLRKRLLSPINVDDSVTPPPSAQQGIRALVHLLERSVVHGEGNSILVTGPKGVGKSWVVEHSLRSLTSNKKVANNYIRVSLNGLTHTDDRTALLEIARQLNLQDQLKDDKSMSFAAVLSFLLETLFSGNRSNQCIVFVLEEFDLFATHKKQILLYNLFNLCQSPVTPVMVVGITSKLNVVELLEKRVKSRFSHRQIQLFPDYTFEEYKRLVVSLLCMPSTAHVDRDYCKKWNDHLEALVDNKDVVAMLHRQFNHSADIASLKLLLSCGICHLGTSSQLLTPELMLQSVSLCPYVGDHQRGLIAGLSVLQLSLLVAMRHWDDLHEGEPFCFEMIYSIYKKFRSRRSHSQELFNKPVSLKAFERLMSLELVTPASNSNPRHVTKEYRLMKLMLDRNQLLEGVRSYPHCPTDLSYWANSAAIT